MKNFVLLFFLFTSIHYSISQECTTEMTQEYIDLVQSKMSITEGCIDDFDEFDLEEDITFNLILYFAKFGDDEGAFDQEDLNSIESNINSVYSPLNIAFTITWIDLDCDECKLDYSMWPLIEPCELSVQGHVISAFSNVTSGGEAIGGIGNGQFYAKPSSVTHELGHALGLGHTFNALNDFVSDERMTRENVEGCPCNCLTTGDLICDTSPDPRAVRNSPGEEEWNSAMFDGCTISNDNDEKDDCDVSYSLDELLRNIRKNIMTYSTCSRDHLTQGQNLMMRRMMSEGNGNYKFQGSSNSDPFSSISNISEPTQLQGYNSFANNVTVESELIIKDATIEFIEGAGFKLMPGSKLILDNAEVRNYSGDNCYLSLGGNTWSGIELFPNDVENIDLEIINNSTLNLSEKNIFNKIGGKAKISIENSSIIAEFEVQNINLVGVTSTIHLVESSFNGKIRFKECSYIEIIGCDLDLPFEVTEGILAENSNLILGNVSNIYNSSVPNELKRMKTGINFVSTGFNLLLVKDAKFIDVFNGITASSPMGISLIRDNIFELSQNDGIFQQRCILLEGFQDFDINGNIFKGTSQSRQTGVLIDGNGNNENPNQIRNNPCQDLQFGMSVEADHGGMFGGIQFLCNNMDNVSFDNFIAFEDIGPSQGDVDNACGNIFDPNNVSWQDFNYQGSQFVNYFYLRNTPNQEPIEASLMLEEFDKEGIDNPAICITPPSGGSGNPQNNGPAAEAETLHPLSKQEEDDLIDDIHIYTSTGEPMDIIDIICSVSPWVPISVILELFEYDEYFTEEEVTEVISSNPAVLYDDYIYDVVYNSNTFTNANQQMITDAFILGDDRLDLIIEIVPTISNLTADIINDITTEFSSTNPDYSVITSLLGEKAFDLKKAQVIDANIQNKDWNEARAALIDFNNRSTYNPFDELEYNTLSNIFDMIITLGEQGKDISMLSPMEEGELELYAMSYHGIATIKARNILQLYFDKSFTNLPEKSVVQDLEFKISPRSISIESSENVDIKISPVPVNDMLFIDVNENNIKSMEILNIQGSIVKKFVQNYSSYNVSSLAEGVYFLKVITPKGDFYLKKFIKK